jgi:hypothetical protein
MMISLVQTHFLKRTRVQFKLSIPDDEVMHFALSKNNAENRACTGLLLGAISFGEGQNINLIPLTYPKS